MDAEDQAAYGKGAAVRSRSISSPEDGTAYRLIHEMCNGPAGLRATASGGGASSSLAAGILRRRAAGEGAGAAGIAGTRPIEGMDVWFALPRPARDGAARGVPGISPEGIGVARAIGARAALVAVPLATPPRQRHAVEALASLRTPRPAGPRARWSSR